MPFWCRECGYCVDNVNMLQDHRMRRHQIKYYQCPRCPYVTDDKLYLVNAHSTARHRGCAIREDEITLALLAPTRIATRPELTSDRRSRLDRGERRPPYTQTTRVEHRSRSGERAGSEKSDGVGRPRSHSTERRSGEYEMGTCC